MIGKVWGRINRSKAREDTAASHCIRRGFPMYEVYLDGWLIDFHHVPGVAYLKYQSARLMGHALLVWVGPAGSVYLFNDEKDHWVFKERRRMPGKRRPSGRHKRGDECGSVT
jgi:hypothetical protein